jgi:hypothetical protein
MALGQGWITWRRRSFGAAHFVIVGTLASFTFGYRVALDLATTSKSTPGQSPPRRRSLLVPDAPQDPPART